MRKLLFVLNPISGGIDKNGFESHIASKCNSANLSIDFFETTGENDKKKLKARIQEFKPTGVIACGGDGTVNMVAEVILGQSINLGIIPLGSANGLATELDISEDVDEAIDTVLNGQPLAMDVLLVNDMYTCLHLSDVGLNAKLIRRFERSSYRGKLGYARHFFETLFKQKPVKYTFTINDRSFQQRAEMVVFANAREYGTGAVVNPIGSLNDRLFEVCIFKPYPWYAIFRLSFLFFTGKLNHSPFVKIYSTQSVVIESKSPEHLQIDGEPMGKFRKVSVSISDHTLPVLVSNNYRM